MVGSESKATQPKELASGSLCLYKRGSDWLAHR